MEKVRVRIAPSPTGKLHLGTARTALFNYLFARKNNGVFVLRFEDTDRSRSTKEFEENIKDGLLWLGLKWDEGPFYQMERLNLYWQRAEILLEKKFAYLKDGALYLNVLAVLEEFKIPYKKVDLFSQKTGEKKQGYLLELPFEDLILGKISGVVEDFVLIRRNKIPTYHFAVVVDDEDMQITHVIRGQDHFSNTPKHFLIQKALSIKHPFYAHIPLILAPGGGKLSKRHGAVAVSEYKKQGYLKEALVNFLVLLGWSPGNDQEIFTLKELEKIFTLERIQKSPAIFDIKKLNYLNSYYLRGKKNFELFELLKESGILEKEIQKNGQDYFLKILEIEKTRIEKLADIKNFDFYFKEPKYPSSLLIFKKSNLEKTKKGLSLVLNTLSTQRNWPQSWENFSQILKEITEKNNLTPGDVFWPTRVALCGKEASPSPAELLWILGKEKSISRLKKALNLLK